jgi:hypothetical protein
MKKQIVAISWDWKEQAELRHLEKVAKLLGGYVYEDPALEGSDSYGFIFSKEPLTKEELKKVSDKENGFSDEEDES